MAFSNYHKRQLDRFKVNLMLSLAIIVIRGMKRDSVEPSKVEESMRVMVFGKHRLVVSSLMLE